MLIMNNEELINNAVATFCAVPEVYQQIFKELESDFPDELVASIKEKPEDAVKMVQNDEQLLNSICTIYSKYADNINAAYKEASQKQTKMFAKGSKLEALVSKKPIEKKQYGGPVMDVRPDTIWENLTNWGTGTKLYDLPHVTDRKIYAKVDPKTGKQKIFLGEVVRGDSVDTKYMINPETRDTVILQTYPWGGRQKESQRTEEIKPNDERYKILMKRLLESGILDAIHTEYPETKKFQNGGGFYRNFTSGDIAKIQTFLAGQGYNVDIDGKIGSQTRNAIMQYQRDHKLTADGMWGHNTNSIHRVLSSDVTNKGSYKPTHRTEVGDMVAYDRPKTVRDITPESFQNLELYYYDHPEEFFDENNKNGSMFREILHNSGDTGAFYINRIYGMMTPEQRKKVTTRVKTKEMIAKDVADAAHEEREKAALPILGTIAAPTAMAAGFNGLLTAPAAAKMGIIGGMTAVPSIYMHPGLGLHTISKK